MLQHLHDNVPGVEVDDATFTRMAGLEGEDAKAAGIEIAVEIVQRLRDVPGVAGVHIMAPRWEAEAVPAVVEGAGIGAARPSPDRLRLRRDTTKASSLNQSPPYFCRTSCVASR